MAMNEVKETIEKELMGLNQLQKEREEARLQVSWQVEDRISTLKWVLELMTNHGQ